MWAKNVKIHDTVNVGHCRNEVGVGINEWFGSVIGFILLLRTIGLLHTIAIIERHGTWNMEHGTLFRISGSVRHHQFPNQV